MCNVVGELMQAPEGICPDGGRGCAQQSALSDSGRTSHGEPPVTAKVAESSSGESTREPDTTATSTTTAKIEPPSRPRTSTTRPKTSTTRQVIVTTLAAAVQDQRNDASKFAKYSAMNDRVEREVGMSGEPKSGTSWALAIIWITVQMLCQTASSPQCEPVGQFDNLINNREFMIKKLRPERLIQLYVENNKHGIPGTKKAGAMCQHETSLPGRPPCVEPKLWEAWKLNPTLDVLDFERCVAQCLERGREFPGPNKFVFHIHRDARDVVISRCFNQGNGGSVDILTSCLKQSYLITAMWVRYRQLWFTSSTFRGQAVHICYRNLVRNHVREYRKVVAAFGLQAADDEMARIIDLSQAAKLKNNTKVVMRDFLGLPKLRDAGAHNYTHYGLSKETVQWMDSIHDQLWHGPPLPCDPGYDSD